MNESDGSRIADEEQALQALLRRAPPRVRPSAAETREARDALRRDWQRLVGRRRRRHYALAAALATVVVVVGYGAAHWLAGPGPAEVVASVDRSSGTVYLLGEREQLVRLEDPGALVTGQTIVTDAGAAIGMQWLAGGSLRVGEQSELEIVAADAVRLLDGVVYYDSGSSSTGGTQLKIITDRGVVRHVGTRFMARTGADVLVVSVRDGRVVIEGRFHEAEAAAGQRVTLAGSATPRTERISPSGPAWEWVEQVGPPPPAHGEPVVELLAWVSRETGLQIEYADTSVRDIVRSKTVAGDISQSPRIALRQSLAILDLAYSIDGGTITIDAAGDRTM